MSQFSEMLGSFIRTGNYPIEANYIFATYEDLVNFYSDEVQKATLHKGLLKIVEQDSEGNQALYWVTKKQTNDELEFTKLVSGTDIRDIIDRIDDLTEQLNAEIAARKSEDTAIWGTADKAQLPDNLNSIMDLANALLQCKQDLLNLTGRVNGVYAVLRALAGCPNDEILNYLETLDYKNLTEASEALHKIQNFLDGFDDDDTLKDLLISLKEELWGDPIPNEQFRTLRGIEDFVEILASATRNRDENLQTELDQTQVGVGLSGDGSYNADNETYYLKNATSVMNALKILDGLINEAINNCNLEVEDSNTINLNINKYRESTVLSANVLISRETGNGIIQKSDGIYYNISSEYENGILTIKVNDNIIAQHVLGLAFVGIKRAYYDPNTESIVMEFKKEDNTTEELRLPVTQLIREWTVDNSGVSDTVLLTRVEDFEGGPDKLSADVRIFSDRYNILTKEGNTLYVKGTADNIVWNDVKVSVILDNLTADLRELQESTTDVSDILDDLDSDLSRLETALNNEINRSTTIDGSLQTQINNLNNSINTAIEQSNTAISKALEIEQNYQIVNGKIDAEIERATNAESDLEDLIRQEKERAEGEEGRLEDRINNFISDLNQCQIDINNLYETKADKDMLEWKNSDIIVEDPTTDEPTDDDNGE